MEKVDIVFMSGTQTGCRYLETIKKHKKANLKLTVTGSDRQRGRGRKLSASRVASYCKNHNMKIFKPENINADNSFKVLKKTNPDAGLVIDYGQILSKKILNLFSIGAYNVHYSLLPDLRGATPVRTALLKGYKETGVSLMKMNKDLDKGEIVFRKKIKIRENDNYGSLKKRQDREGQILVKKLIDSLACSNIPDATCQKEWGLGSYAPKMKKDICRINWHKDSQKIINKIKALTPGPGCYTFKDDKTKRIKIIHAEPYRGQLSGTPGEIIKVRKKYFVVASQKGGVKILKLQPAGKRVMETSAYLAGRNLKVGDKFQ